MVVVTAIGTSGPAVTSGQDSPGLHRFAKFPGKSVGVARTMVLVIEGEAVVLEGWTATVGFVTPAKSSRPTRKMCFILS